MAIWDRLSGGIIGLGIGGAIGRAVRPIFELVEQQSWDGNPNRVLPANTLAELVATAIVDFNGAAGEAQRQGYTANRLRALSELALRTPTIGQAMDARRRDKITADQYLHVLRKAGIEPQYDAAMVALLEVLASPTDLVHMAVREVFDPGQRAALDLDAEFPPSFADRAAKLGIPGDLARDYWADHWQLPSYEQLAEMLFRNELTPGEFSNALRAIDYAPTWRGKLEAIARRIPTVTDMVRFAVRDVYDPQAVSDLGIGLEFPAVFAQEASQHGLSADHAKQYWAAHWRLPSARQGYQMLWRGEITEAQLRQLLKALDYPAPWRPRLMNIAYLRPGRIDLKRLLKHGIYDRAQVKAGYQAIGYAEPEAEALTLIAEAEQASGQAATTWINRARTQLWNTAHREYLDESIGDVEAGAHLDQIGVPTTERQTILGLWAVEKAIRRRELTPSQIRTAVKAGRMEVAEGLARLEDARMTPDDALIFLES